MHSADDLSTIVRVWFPETRNISAWVNLSGSHINLRTISVAPLTSHRYVTRRPNNHLSWPNLVGLLICQQSPPRSIKVCPLFLPLTGIISCIIVWLELCLLAQARGSDCGSVEGLNKALSTVSYASSIDTLSGSVFLIYKMTYTSLCKLSTAS